MALFTLVFAVEIAHKKAGVSGEEKELFLKLLLSMPDCHRWRETDH